MTIHSRPWPIQWNKARDTLVLLVFYNKGTLWRTPREQAVYNWQKSAKLGDMDAEQNKPSSMGTSTSSRSSSFSVEALISKPVQKTSNIINEPNLGSHSNFSVERILNKQHSREEDNDSKVEVSSPDKRCAREQEETSSDYPWMHSTRYDPPPRKFILSMKPISFKFLRKHLNYNCFNCLYFIILYKPSRLEQHGPFL